MHVTAPNPGNGYQSVAEPFQHPAPTSPGLNVPTPAIHAQPNSQGQLEQTLLAVANAVLQMQGQVQQLNTAVQALQSRPTPAPPSPGVPITPPTEPMSANALTPTMAGPPVTLSAPLIATGTLTPNTMTSSHNPSIFKGSEIQTSLSVVKNKKRWLSWVRKLFGLKPKNKGPELIQKLEPSFI